MHIKVTKLTDYNEMKKAMEFTSGNSVKLSPQTITKMYDAEHSVIRTQMYSVEMYDIPTFVSVHLVRHTVGTTHFVKSNRDDKQRSEKADRNTPVQHLMHLNAQSLINMARRRLCHTAHAETVTVMNEILARVKSIDPVLSEYLVPMCVYRKGCHEPKGCGYYAKISNS